MFHVLANPLPYEIPMVGEVEKIFTTYGFVQTRDMRRYFFHFGTCASKPELLKVGDVVEFVLGEDVKTHRLHAQKVRKINLQESMNSPSAPAAAILNTLPPAAVFVSAQTLLTVTTLPTYHQQQQAAAAARLALANGFLGGNSNALVACSSNPSPSTASTSAATTCSMPMVYPATLTALPTTVVTPVVPASAGEMAAIAAAATAAARANSSRTMNNGLVKNENTGQSVTSVNAGLVKRAPLRPILSQQQAPVVQATRESDLGKVVDGSPLSWNSFLFKQFVGSGNGGAQLPMEEATEKMMCSRSSSLADPYERARNAWYSVRNEHH